MLLVENRSPIPELMLILAPVLRPQSVRLDLGLMHLVLALVRVLKDMIDRRSRVRQIWRGMTRVVSNKRGDRLVERLTGRTRSESRGELVPTSFATEHHCAINVMGWTTLWGSLLFFSRERCPLAVRAKSQRNS
jgi:hypothetical protein